MVSRPAGERRFIPLRSRWVVERTFAWLGRYRRLSKDYEHMPESSEAVVKIAAIHHYLRRLCPQAGATKPTLPVQGTSPKTSRLRLLEQTLSSGCKTLNARTWPSRSARKTWPQPP